MKVTTLILSLCMLVITMTGCTSAKVGIVHPERLFQDSTSGKAGMEHLRQIEVTLQKQLGIAQGYIEKDPENEALRAYLQTIFQEYQQAITEEQQKVMESINTQLENALNSVREKDGYTVLLNAETTLSSTPNADATNAILTEMDTNPLSFETFTIKEIVVPDNVMKPVKK